LAIARFQALRRDLSLLLDRPPPPPLTARDHLDPLAAHAHTISRTSVLSVSYRFGRFVVHHHGQHASHHNRVAQCGLNAPLTHGEKIHCNSVATDRLHRLASGR
jgi:hypothetical protein